MDSEKLRIRREKRNKTFTEKYGKLTWNKGLTKKTDSRLMQQSEKMKGNRYTPQTEFKEEHKHSEEVKKKLSSKWVYSKHVTERMKEINRQKFLGENNPNWNNGSSFEDYGKEFDLKFKNFIRNRDNQVCMNCGIHREKTKWALDVHHIDYNKLNTIPQNCIALCRNCHFLTNKNREYWKELLQNKLSIIYNYSYSQNGEVIIKVE